MKKKLFALLLIITMLLSITRVCAEDDEDNVIIERTAGGYKFIIEKFAVRLYAIDFTDYEKYTESLKKYQKNEVTEEVEIPLTEVNMTPSTFAKSKDGLTVQFVELKTDFTKEKIYNAIKNNIDDVDENKGYIGELVVYYNVTETPEGYNTYYSVNSYKHALWKDDIKQPERLKVGLVKPEEEVDLEETTTQVINMIRVTKEYGFDFFTKEKDVSPIFLMNYFGIADVTEPEAASDDDGYLTDIKHVLMLTNVTDTATLAENFLSIEDLSDPYASFAPTDPEDFINEEDPSAVEVPDTAMNKNQIILIIGLILITLGTGVVSKVIYKNE